MKQYNSIKAKHPDALLLFRVGDFYETFAQDAIKTSRILGIVLTKRQNGAASSIELAGFPHHALDTYLPKLVRAGQRVAICDQLEDPKLTKSIVKRGVTELVTPGVSYNDKTLDQKTNNFLSAVHINNKNAGIAFLDVSTGEFYVAQGSKLYIDKLLQSFSPNEILIERSKVTEFKRLFGSDFYTYHLDEWVFSEDFGKDLLLKHFGTTSLKGFGIEELNEGIVSAGVCLHYLKETSHDKVLHINSISRIEEEHYVWLDKFTIINLELFQCNSGGVTLIDLLDQTISPMGSRLMKRWIALPLKEKLRIEERLDAVEYLMEHEDVADVLSGALKQIGDLERLISKVSTGRVTPREVQQIKVALSALVPVKENCSKTDCKALAQLAGQLDLCSMIRNRIDRELQENPPLLISKGNVIAEGVDESLDELRKMAYSGKDYLLQLQQRESERTGITSLKVGFNNVFGYYLEVTNVHKSKVPENWIRKQTLVNAERYITEELKTYEEKILGAEEKILMIETELFNKLLMALSDYITPIQHDASLIARLDCLLSFARLSIKKYYCRPEIDKSYKINIKNGRHPVIEHRLPLGEQYVPNDVFLDNESQQIMVITGPNMSGKSAYLRQTGIIVLMAQMGCFVPADSACIGITDKVFCRVGASDNISLGESTFMVEMNETASILNNLSSRSLVLLDEIGRGTSTYDGISIAWAIAEHIHQSNERAKTLFATHYHELNEMAKSFNRIKNYNVSVRESGNKVIFLRKVYPGGSEHSFGIHVARMAGMPKNVLKRAEKLMAYLEKTHSKGEFEKKIKEELPNKDTSSDMQLSFFQLDDPVLSQIRDQIDKTDINTLTPIEAMMRLNEIKKLIGD